MILNKLFSNKGIFMDYIGIGVKTLGQKWLGFEPFSNMHFLS